MKSGILAASMFAMAGLAATSAYAYDVTALRDSRADYARAQLDSNGFRYVGTYNDFDNEWKMWFNRRTGECAGITEKGRNISRAKTFKTDRCRDADRGGFGGRPDHGDHYGPPPGGGYGDHYGDRDVPRWVVGYFRGYNRAYGADVTLEISADGSVVATVNGARSYGHVRDGKLRVGPNQFTLDRDDNGFTTRQIGNEGNVVHYHRR